MPCTETQRLLHQEGVFAKSDVLRYRHMKREGAITFNGCPSTKRLKRNIGFVMQVCAVPCLCVKDAFAAASVASTLPSTYPYCGDGQGL